MWQQTEQKLQNIRRLVILLHPHPTELSGGVCGKGRETENLSKQTGVGREEISGKAVKW